jgi:ABC-type glycerol-3-phosphate transport system permease component
MLQNQAPLPSTGSSFNNNTYNPVASSNPVQDQETNLLATADQRLKSRIRVLKLVSRIVALVLSLATLIPLATTLTKFFETKSELIVVDGQERTAWAKGSRAWYTYMYFGVALTSFVFDLAIVVAYCRGVKKANKVAGVAVWWSTAVQVGHVVIWILSAAIYRYGKEPVGGKFRDLWGW